MSGHRIGAAWVGSAELAERLLERTHLELEHADRPLVRIVADRCLVQMVQLCEALAEIERTEPHHLSDRTARSLRSAQSSLGRAQWSLEFVRRKGAIPPSAFRSVSAGLSVLSRRLVDSARH